MSKINEIIALSFFSEIGWDVVFIDSGFAEASEPAIIFTNHKNPDQADGFFILSVKDIESKNLDYLENRLRYQKIEKEQTIQAKQIDQLLEKIEGYEEKISLFV